MQPESKQWYIAVVTPNTEKACEKKLARWAEYKRRTQPIELETYVPSQRELHEWPSTGRRKWVDRIICPCFLFVRCTESVRYAIKAENLFILHFLKDRATRKDGDLVPPFAVVSPEQMNDFRQMVGDADTPVMLDASLPIGSKVRIKTGRLQGFTGYLYRVPGRGTRFCIKVDLLGYASMEIDAAMLEEVKE